MANLSQAAQLVRFGLLAYGSQSFAPDLRTLRVQLPFIEQVTPDAEFFGDLGHWLSGTNEFNCLSFELWGVAFAWLGIHLG